MRKEIIKQGFLVKMTFNKWKLTCIESNIFWPIPVIIENTKKMETAEFEYRAMDEMKRKYNIRKRKTEKWRKKREEIFKKYWI